MSRVRRYLFLAALGVGAAGCRSVGPAQMQLPEKLDARLADSARACVTRLNRDRTLAQRAMQTSDLLLLLGAAAGASGSLLAAYLTKPRARRASALVGAVGALTAAGTKTLDDPSEILTRRARAERHWVVGYKVLTQATLAAEPPLLAAQSKVVELTGEPARTAMELSKQQHQRALRYVLDRFIDCSADQPPENFEELPTSGFFALDEGVASAKLSPPDTEGGVQAKAAPSVLIYAEPEPPAKPPEETTPADREPEPTRDAGGVSP